MRILGIDYGAKRVGLALSDEPGQFAYPHSIIANQPLLAKKVAGICAKEQVGTIVLGQSLNHRGQPNLIMTKMEKFKKSLAKLTNLPIVWEPELFTTALARRSPGNKDMLDAMAAALILQTYLDRTL
jgi:putative Holliday junction resolvase